MPGFNQRGPMNEGPMTGRQMGRCAENYPREDMEYAGHRRTTPGWWTRHGHGQTWRPPSLLGHGDEPGHGMGRCGKHLRHPRHRTPRRPFSARAQQLEAELKAIKTRLDQMGEE